MSVKEVLDELEIYKDYYYRAEDLELYSKRKPTSCFVNNYFDIGLKAWQANIDIESVFNKYKTVICMCQCFSKTEHRCLRP